MRLLPFHKYPYKHPSVAESGSEQDPSVCSERTSAQEDVVGRRVPAEDAHSFGVTVQFDDGVCER